MEGRSRSTCKIGVCAPEGGGATPPSAQLHYYPRGGYSTLTAQRPSDSNTNRPWFTTWSKAVLGFVLGLLPGVGWFWVCFGFTTWSRVGALRQPSVPLEGHSGCLGFLQAGYCGRRLQAAQGGPRSVHVIFPGWPRRILVRWQSGMIKRYLGRPRIQGTDVVW